MRLRVWGVLLALGCGGDKTPTIDAASSLDGGNTHDAAEADGARNIDAARDAIGSIEDAGHDSTTSFDAAGDAAIQDAGPVCPPVYALGQSRCSVGATMASCSHDVHEVEGREVYSQTPVGTPPPEGWPAVVVYQGTGYGPDVTWSGDDSLPYGGLYQVKLQAMLLDNGFVVIAPFADGVAWNTNFPGYSVSSDSRFIPALIDAIEAGTFGDVNVARLYATGISSGGYMTSRMAVSYGGTFRALAIQSGSYATCTNVACVIPLSLPDDHPPTLFLHGERDLIVPLATAEAYKARLDDQGIETAIVLDPMAAHEWLEVAPEEITCWFKTH